jgi:hypothetical protein
LFKAGCTQPSLAAFAFGLRLGNGWADKSLRKIGIQFNLPAMTNPNISRAKTVGRRSTP